MVRNSTKTALIALVLALPVAANADGVYYGFGAGYTSAESAPNAVTTNNSEAGFGVLSGVVGYQWDGTTFYGVEADADFSFGADFDDEVTGLPCTTNASGPYYCTHDATLRLRGVMGQDIGNGYDVYGALGVGFMFGDGATSPTTQDSGVNYGVTIGLGVERQLGNGNTVRTELTYDNFSSTQDNPAGIYSPDYKAVSVRVQYLLSK